MILTEAATGDVPQKNVLLEISQNSQENTCTTVTFLNKVANFSKFQVFSCEFCEISKNMIFTEHLLAATSDITESGWLLKQLSGKQSLKQSLPKVSLNKDV